VAYVEPVAESRQDELQAKEEEQDRLIAAALAKAAPPSKQKTKASKSKQKKPGSWNVAKAVAGPIAVVFILFVMSRLLLVFPKMLGNDSSASITINRQQPDAASSSSLSAGELGVDIYPGARALSDGDHINSSERSVVSQAFVTADQMNMVINFYKARMTGQTSIYASGDGVVVSISPRAQESILVTISPAQSGGKTKILISHTITKS
jgi:hypothetical protein